jgi:hypothetical protein
LVVPPGVLSVLAHGFRGKSRGRLLAKDREYAIFKWCEMELRLINAPILWEVPV